MSRNLGSLQAEWSSVFGSAVKAESFVYPDPRRACVRRLRPLEPKDEL